MPIQFNAGDKLDPEVIQWHEQDPRHEQVDPRLYLDELPIEYQAQVEGELDKLGASISPEQLKLLEQEYQVGVDSDTSEANEIEEAIIKDIRQIRPEATPGEIEQSTSEALLGSDEYQAAIGRAEILKKVVSWFNLFSSERHGKSNS